MTGDLRQAWAPVRAWLRLDLRRRWRSLVVLTLLVAVSAAIVMAAVAGARRGGSSLQRLEARTLPATVAALPNQPGFDWAKIRRLPDVAALSEFPVAGFDLEGPAKNKNVAFPVADDSGLHTIERPVVLSGRLPDPARVDEAVVTANFIGRGTRVGDTVVARLDTPAQATDTSDGVVAAGPRQPLTIVGVIRSPWYNDAQDSPTGTLVVGPAFYAKYKANLIGADGSGFVNALVRLRGGGADVPAFTKEFARVTGRSDVDFLNLVAQAKGAQKTLNFERDALLAFALAAMVAAAVLLGQAIARYAAVAAADLQVLRTLGMSSRQTVVAAAAGPVLAAVGGALLAAGAAIAASPIFPIGAATPLEPDPGIQVDLPVLAGVGALMVVLLSAAAAVTAALSLAAQRSAATPRRSAVATTAHRLGLPVPVVVGMRFALEPGRGRSAVPVRPALVGAVVGVLGVLAAVTFRAGVVDAAASPALFGQTAQLQSFRGFNGQDFAPAAQSTKVNQAWARDPDVRGIDEDRLGVVTVNSEPISVNTVDVVGDKPYPFVTLSGRMPTAPDEITVSPGSAAAAHIKVGDTVTAAGRATVRLRVVGLAFIQAGPHDDYNHGAWITTAGYARAFPDEFFKYDAVQVAVDPKANLAAVTKRLAATAEAVAGGPVDLEPAIPDTTRFEIRNVKVLPLALGAFLALLAVGASGHALATAVRRRRRDVAVLRALGMTRRQTRLIVVTQATTLAVTGLVFGVPLGIALGRVVWRAVATSTPLVYVTPVAVLALLLVAPVALAAGNVLAALPARRAARIRVPDVLRAE